MTKIAGLNSGVSQTRRIDKGIHHHANFNHARKTRASAAIKNKLGITNKTENMSNGVIKWSKIELKKGRSEHEADEYKHQSPA